MPPWPKIYPHGIKVVELAEVTGFNYFLHPTNGSGIDEGMIHHQSETLSFGYTDELLGLFDCAGHGFFHKHMFVSFQSALCERMMSEDRCCQNHRIYLRIAQDFLGVGRNLDTRITFTCSAAPLGAQTDASLNLHPLSFV